jgi:hypothetical protein
MLCLIILLERLLIFGNVTASNIIITIKWYSQGVSFHQETIEIPSLAGRALKEIARVLKNNGRLVICHTMSRAMINQLHQSVGGVIANDLLPDASQLRGLTKQARLKITHFEDSPERYLVIAEKRAR